jgi:hypothetical protein
MWKNSIIYILEYVFIIRKIKNVKTTHELIIHHQKELQDSMMDIFIAQVIFKHAPQILQLGGGGGWGVC